jgi:O-antigen/teichoic acid export membrane protein
MVVAAARLLSAVLGIATPVILVRALDQTEFGQYKQAFLVAGTAVAVMSFGLPGSLYYFVPRSAARAQRYLSQTLLLLCAFGALSAGAVLAAADLVGTFFHSDSRSLPYWLAALVGFAVPAAMLPIAPTVDRRAKLGGLLLAGTDLTRGVAMITAALFLGSVESVIAAAALVAAASTAVTFGYLAWRPRPPDSSARGALAEQARYAAPMAASAYVVLARDQYHSYFVAATFSPAQFAVYAIGTLTVPLIHQILMSLGEVLVLETSRHHALRDQAEMRRVWDRVVHLQVLAIVPLFCALQMFAHDVIRLLYGDAYGDAAGLFRWYLLTLLVMITPMSPMLRATGDTRTIMLADALSTIAAIATILMLTPVLGLTGAVLGVVIGSGAYALASVPRVARRLGHAPLALVPWRHLAVVGFASIGSAALASVLLQNAPGPARAILGPGLTLSAVALIVLRWRMLPSSEHALVIDRFRRTLPRSVYRCLEVLLRLQTGTRP